MTIRWGLVGCGDIATKRVAPALIQHPDSELAAVAAPEPDALAGFAKHFGISAAFATMEAMLAQTDVDAVYIATPVASHFALALEALKQGRHVLVEKPLALTPAEAKQLVYQAKQSDLRLGTAYYRRFFPKLAEIERLLAAGAIGEVIQTRVIYHSWYNPPSDDPKAWRLNKAQAGGGPLWDMGCHKIDMLLALVGDVTSVQAQMSTLTHAYGVEDSCSVLLELASGAHAQLAFHWNSKVWADEFEIIGTEGKIVLAPCDGDGLQLERPASALKGLGSEITRVSLPNHANVHYPLIADFAAAVAEHRPPIVDGQAGLRVNQLLAAIEAAAEDGSRIQLTNDN